MSSGDDNEMPEVDVDPVDVEPVDGGESSEGSGDDRAGGGPDIVSTPDSSRPILEEPDTDSGRVDQEDAQEDEFVGKRLKGTYEIVEKIGEGGMGTVYAAIQDPLDRRVAVKLIKPGETSEAGELYFKREVRIINMLRHPNVVNILDFGSDDEGLLYLVMEYLPGRTLRDVIAEDVPVAPERICNIATQVLGALEQAHSEDVVHCDLKPANIMIEPVAGQEDFIKVLDFGIAKVKGPAQEVGPHTQQGDLVGTFDYMSPEQIMREDVDGRADVWSLGVIMHEMISGERIFYADDGAEIIGRVMRSEIPPPSEFNPDVPEALEAVIMGALQRELEERYDSAAEMRERVAEAEDRMRRSGQIGAGQAGEVGVSESVDQADAVGEELETRGAEATMVVEGDEETEDAGELPEDVLGAGGAEESLFGDERETAVVAVTLDEQGDRVERVFRRTVRDAAVGEDLEWDADGRAVVFDAQTLSNLSPYRAAVEFAAEFADRLSSRDLPVPGIGFSGGEIAWSEETGEPGGEVVERAGELSSAGRRRAAYADLTFVERADQSIAFGSLETVAGRRAARVLERDDTSDGPDESSATAESRRGPDALVRELVDRDRVRSRLDRAASSARDGDGTALALVGPERSGKSLLLTRFVDDLAGREFLVGSADREIGLPTFSPPIGRWIRAVARLHGDPEQVLERAVDRMGLIDGRRSAVALLVGDLASVAADELPWSSPEEFRHFAAGLSDILLDRACRAGAACVFVEGTDPQDRLWCDFLEQIAPQIEQRPVLVVLTCDSPDPFEPADYPGEIESVGVRAPRANEVENLVDDRYGDVVSRSVSRKVGDCVDGDVEVFRQLVERVDREAADGGEVRWRASSSAALLMRTVRSNLRARLDSIGDRRRAALGFAATFDGPFRLEWLTDPAFSGVELGDSDVDDFEDSGVFDVWRDRSGTTRAAFHSPVHREVLHRAQSDESVRDSDVRVVNELARRDPGDRLEWLESRRELARRLRQLGRFEASAKARRPLAQGLFDRYHCGEAIRVWKGAVADLDDRADVDLDDDLRVELLLAAARGHREVGDGSGAEALGRKLPSIRRLPDAVAFRALYEVGATFLDNDRLERAERAFERLQKRAAGAAAPGWSARAFHALSMVFEEREDQQAALRSLERAVERLEQSPELDFTDRDDRRLYWAPYNRLGTNYLTQGEMGRAKTVLERALKRAEAVEDARGLIRVRSNLGALYLNASDERRARDYFEEALAISERSGDVLNEARVAINLGVAAQRSGDLIESKERFERAHRLAKAISWEEGLQKMSPHIDKLQRSLA